MTALTQIRPARSLATETAAPITVVRGDGIGPEIMLACLRILEAAGARLEVREVAMGEAVYLSGNTSGIPSEAWDVLRETGVLYKAPITTPQGGGYKSLNVTMRKTMGLYANVRPCVAYAPFVATNHPDMNLVIVRENEEDLYAGIEHRQTDDVYQCLKIVSRPGCERIVRYAFDHARLHGRKKVTCMTKDNIMKLTDGLFRQVFEEIGAEYPDIARDHMIIDIGAAMIADRPERFDVVVTPNLYGDIVSDIAAQVAGSVGLAASANVGEHLAMFEAIHGSAPDIAGQDRANPSGLLLAGVMMLRHLGQHEVAARVQDAWSATIEDGIHTADIASPASAGIVGTAAFADAVIARLGHRPARLPRAATAAGVAAPARRAAARKAPARKEIVGVDVFVQFRGTPAALGQPLKALTADTGLTLRMITNRGVKVWPSGQPETFCTDHWRCRFLADEAGVTPTSHATILNLLSCLAAAGVDFVKTEHLCTFDGVPGYSLGQGQ